MKKRRYSRADAGLYVTQGVKTSIEYERGFQLERESVEKQKFSCYNLTVEIKLKGRIFMLFKGDYIIQEENIQEELIDVSRLGEVRPWKEKKIKNSILADMYEEINKSKSVRLKDCATYLCFKTDSLGLKTLEGSNFCKVRLCPMCCWRRSMKVFGQVNEVLEGVQAEKKYEYLFLTLTIKNCVGEELKSVLDILMYSWNKFLKVTSVKKVVKGWYRGLEVTHNLDCKSEGYDTYHPHFHCVLAVDKSYFSGRSYLTQDKWTSIWKKVLNVEYTPIVNVKKIKGCTAKMVAEVAKYTVKDSDYIRETDWDLSKETINVLDKALNHRRLIAFGGVFKSWHKKKKMDKEKGRDLKQVEEDHKQIDMKANLEDYSWYIGYQQYRRVK